MKYTKPKPESATELLEAEGYTMYWEQQSSGRIEGCGLIVLPKEKRPTPATQ